jgi:translation initiation factor eIF-2B subunit delta
LVTRYSMFASPTLTKNPYFVCFSQPTSTDPRDYPAQFLGIQLGGDNDEYNNLHPAVLAAGRAYAMGGTIRGGNTRCRLMLDALSKAMEDYVPTKGCKDVRHDISNVVLKPSFAYWTHHCRPHSVSMGNAFSFVKSAVAALDRDLAQQWSSEGPCEAKLLLQESMDAYVQERIHYADQAIAHYVSDKSIIQDGDVILTYGNYEVIAHVLIEAARRKTDFRVICVDSKPLLEGQLLVRALREEDDTIDCTYILLNALSFVMKDVTKVLLGAEALMNDGSVYARVGTACVASCCKKKNKAVLVCAETYKISHRVQLEAITNNELGNPKDVLADSDDGDDDNLRVIPLLYDLTPADFLSGIVTEMGILPPTSVAVLLREMNPDAAANTLGGF